MNTYYKTINPIEFYLDYFNNYLTVQAISDVYGISESLSHKLINLGRKLNNND
tara:strand:+ start:921 stop:1079 length:159 start_codon:yes stop_codon:yes gene_type:complete